MPGAPGAVTTLRETSSLDTRLGDFSRAPGTAQEAAAGENQIRSESAPDCEQARRGASVGSGMGPLSSSALAASTRRYLIYIQYRGSGFNGCSSNRMANSPVTVQDALEVRAMLRCPSC